MPSPPRFSCSSAVRSATRAYGTKVSYVEPAKPAKIVQSQDKKNRKLRYENYDKINPDPYAHAKRAARRLAATPALRSHPVGPASRTPPADTCRLLECPRLAVARAHGAKTRRRDRKSTRLNSSHITISYAVFCLKKKKTN